MYRMGGLSVLAIELLVHDLKDCFAGYISIALVSQASTVSIG